MDLLKSIATISATSLEESALRVSSMTVSKHAALASPAPYETFSCGAALAGSTAGGGGGVC